MDTGGHPVFQTYRWERRNGNVTIIEKLREKASLEKKMDIRHLLKKADSQHNDESCVIQC